MPSIDHEIKINASTEAVRAALTTNAGIAGAADPHVGVMVLSGPPGASSSTAAGIRLAGWASRTEPHRVDLHRRPRRLGRHRRRCSPSQRRPTAKTHLLLGHGLG